MKHLGLLCLASATKELPHVSLGSKARKQQRKANTVARNQAVPAAATAAVDPLRHMRAARQRLRHGLRYKAARPHEHETCLCRKSPHLSRTHI